MPAANLSIVLKISGGLLPPNSRAGDVEIYDNGRIVIFESDTDVVERQMDRQEVSDLINFSRQAGFFQLEPIMQDSGASPNVPDVTISIMDATGTATVTMTSYQKLRGEVRQSPFDKVYKRITDSVWAAYISGKQPPAEAKASVPPPAPPAPPMSMPAQQPPADSVFSDLPSLDDLLKDSNLDFSGPDSLSKTPSLPPLQDYTPPASAKGSAPASLPPLQGGYTAAPQSGDPFSLPPLNNSVPPATKPVLPPLAPNLSKSAPQAQPAKSPQPRTAPPQPKPAPATVATPPQVTKTVKPPEAAAPKQDVKVKQQHPQQTSKQEHPPVVEPVQPAAQPKPAKPTIAPEKQPPALKLNLKPQVVEAERVPKDEERPAPVQKTQPRPEPPHEKPVEVPQKEQRESKPLIVPSVQLEKVKVQNQESNQLSQQGRAPMHQDRNVSQPGFKKPPLAWEHTQELITRLEDSLHGKLLTFYIADDHEITIEDIRYLYSHLRKLGSKKTLYLLPIMQEGQITVVWRMATLLREFCQELIVLLPDAASVPTTLLSLSANSIFMNPFGHLRPIETTFSHPILDQEYEASHVKVPLSEVLQASLVKETLEKTPRTKSVDSEDSVQQNALHPLVVTAAQRQFALTKMICQNLLKLNPMLSKSPEKIAQISSQLLTGFPTQDYPIAFFEAEALGLNLKETTEEMNDLLWDLLRYYSYITKPAIGLRGEYKTEEQQAILIESTGRRTVYYKERHYDKFGERLLDQHDRWREATMDLAISQEGKHNSHLQWKELQIALNIQDQQ